MQYIDYRLTCPLQYKIQYIDYDVTLCKCPLQYKIQYIDYGLTLCKCPLQYKIQYIDYRLTCPLQYKIQFIDHGLTLCKCPLQYKIQYIDYGNVEEVTSSALVEIPSNLANLKGMASKIMLHNTRAKDLSDKMVNL